MRDLVNVCMSVSRVENRRLRSLGTTFTGHAKLLRKGYKLLELWPPAAYALSLSHFSHPSSQSDHHLLITNLYISFWAGRSIGHVVTRQTIERVPSKDYE